MKSTILTKHLSGALCALTFGLVVSLLANTASATIIHPDVMGDTVIFSGISEDSAAGVPLYDTPSAIGDSLDFPTTADFSAQSNDGVSDSLDGRLQLMITAKPGNTIEEISISEGLFGELSAPFGGDAFASVSAGGIIDVVDPNGGIIPFLLSFTPDREFQLSSDGSGPFTSVGEVTVSLPAGTTKVNITLDNRLRAATTDDNATEAFIDKKDFNIEVVTVPEPASLAFAALGIVGLLSTRRSIR